MCMREIRNTNLNVRKYKYQGQGSLLFLLGGETTHVKLPIFSEFMENLTKFMKKSGQAKMLESVLFGGQSWGHHYEPKRCIRSDVADSLLKN